MKTRDWLIGLGMIASGGTLGWFLMRDKSEGEGGITSIDFTREPAGDVNPGSLIHFYASVESDVPCTCNWDYGDGTGANGVSCGGIVGHEYAAVGDYTVKLTAVPTDTSFSSKSKSYTVKVVSGGVPVAAFSYSPINPAPGTPVAFVNESMNVSPDALYHWDFGDGLTSDAENPTHMYSQEGIYTVVLTVTDGTQQDGIHKDVAVAPTGLGYIMGYVFCECWPIGYYYNEPGVDVVVRDSTGAVVGSRITDGVGHWAVEHMPMNQAYTIEFTHPTAGGGRKIIKTVVNDSTPCQCADALFFADVSKGETCNGGSCS